MIKSISHDPGYITAIVVSVVIVVLIVFLAKSTLDARPPKVAVGQVWEETVNKGSPWNEWRYTKEVVAISNGWVRYRYESSLGREGYDIGRLNMFAYDAKRIR